jgi:hypothetical protein
MAHIGLRAGVRGPAGAEHRSQRRPPAGFLDSPLACFTFRISPVAAVPRQCGSARKRTLCRRFLAWAICRHSVAGRDAPWQCRYAPVAAVPGQFSDFLQSGRIIGERSWSTEKGPARSSLHMNCFLTLFWAGSRCWLSAVASSFTMCRSVRRQIN